MRVLAVVPYILDAVPGQRFRIEQWVRELSPEEASFDFHAFESDRLHEIRYQPGRHVEKVWQTGRGVGRTAAFIASLRPSDYDVAYLFREILPAGPVLLEPLLARRFPVVYDFDDAIYLQAVSSANSLFGRLKNPGKTGTICALSSEVVVGNHHLADYARRFSKNVTVIPSTIDTVAYSPKEDAGIRGAPVIGWSGSHTTVEHLRVIAPVLRELRRDLEFRLTVMGAGAFSLEGVAVSSERWSPSSELPVLRTFDIGIMPLPDDEWSRGKCGMKALQYMALGIPTVASPVGANKEIIQDGVNGFLAATPGEWISKLTLLARDESLRRRLGAEGRRTVEKSYSAKAQAPRFLDVLTAAASRTPS